LREQREGELREANVQSRRALEAARQEGADVRRRMRAEADAEGQRVIGEAKRRAEAELEPLRQELQGQIEKLATTAAGRVLGRG